MNGRDSLYRLSKYFPISNAVTLRGDSERDYEGQLIFSGPDASIEVEAGKIKGYINGQRSHPKGQLDALIEEHEDSLLRTADKLKQDGTVLVVFSGKWHHIDFHSEPRFEGYLVHLVDGSGGVVTTRYQSEVFDWDEPGMNEGCGFTAFLCGDPATDFESLNRHAKKKMAPFREKGFMENGLPAFDGILWYPSVSGLPYHVTMANADSRKHVSNPGDGTILSATRERIKAVKEAPGAFRGAIVKRKEHRPFNLTLDEVFASTDAVGYWVQTWDGMSDPDATYELAFGKLKHGDVMLTKIDASTDKDALENSYASEWMWSGGSDDTKFRLLAVCSVPGICRDPL